MISYLHYDLVQDIEGTVQYFVRHEISMYLVHGAK